MRESSKEWDREFGRSLEHNVVVEGKLVPKNRPCDCCGALVDVGFIHKNPCAEEERDLYMGILY